MADQKTNVGNQGDIVKHSALPKVVDRLSNGKKEFWYVETHAGYPYYFLDDRGKWKQGIGKVCDAIDQQWNNVAPRPTEATKKLLQNYQGRAYQKQNGHNGFPANRTYLGSAAQVYQVLREKKIRIRMTLFDNEPKQAEELCLYFKRLGANVIRIVIEDEPGWFNCLRPLWDTALAEAKDKDFVMVVQGHSYKLAPQLWSPRADMKYPDLVFVDPYRLDDGTEVAPEPEGLLRSLPKDVPFMCWTPLNGKTTGLRADWTFLIDGVPDARRFVTFCKGNELTCAWFSWHGSNQPGTYGCQLTFGNVFSEDFRLAEVWSFQPPADLDANGLPYLESEEHPMTTKWRTPDQCRNDRMEPQAPDQQQPGVAWWNSYCAAFWWP